MNEKLILYKYKNDNTYIKIFMRDDKPVVHIKLSNNESFGFPCNHGDDLETAIKESIRLIDNKLKAGYLKNSHVFKHLKEKKDNLNWLKNQLYASLQPTLF